MSRSFKHQPFAAICGNGSSQYDKTHAARGVRRRCRHELHKALRSEEFDVLLPHKRECTHNNTYDWNRDGSQHYCGLSAKDWQRYIAATTPGLYSRFGIPDFYYGDEDYMMWPPLWYQRMMHK
jgi:hypothetical protein